MGNLLKSLLRPFGDGKKPDPRIQGILNERKAFTGPKTAQVDITNNCNLNCVGCWCHSELMGELKFRGDFKKKYLSLEKIKQLINDLNELNTEEIQLSGSGDPSMHPDFIEVVEYIKKRKFKLHIITNFTLLTKGKIEKLVELGVNNLTVSFWAGSVKTYLRTHPNQNGLTYYKILENLQYLHSIKDSENMPKVRIYNVISSLNYYEIQEMVDFAISAKADQIEFQVVDIVEGKSDSLGLTKDMAKDVLKQFMSLAENETYINVSVKQKKNSLGNKIHKKEFKEFSRIIKTNTLPEFFRFKWGLDKMNVFCRKNVGTKLEPHGSIRVKEDNKRENAFKFYFDRKVCQQDCKYFKDCAIDKKRFLIKAEFLTFLGIGTFLRRVSNIANKDSLKKQKHDINIVDTMPCYIGWTFTRVLPNGDVLPCCKGHKKPLGNLYEKSFKDIWYSDTYNKFRHMAKTKKKSHPYFKVINCHKSCDNVGMNLETHMVVKKR